MDTMKFVTDAHARHALKSILDEVNQDADVTIFSCRDAEGDAVVISLDSYKSIMETLHLTGNPANAAALAMAITQDKAGQARYGSSILLNSCACYTFCV